MSETPAIRGAIIQVRCACCKNQFTARVADQKRGWGKFCSKRCKAIRQTQKGGPSMWKCERCGIPTIARAQQGAKCEQCREAAYV